MLCIHVHSFITCNLYSLRKTNAPTGIYRFYLFIYAFVSLPLLFPQSILPLAERGGGKKREKGFRIFKDRTPTKENCIGFKNNGKRQATFLNFHTGKQIIDTNSGDHNTIIYKKIVHSKFEQTSELVCPFEEQTAAL